MKQQIMKCSACGENRVEYFKYDPVTRTTYCVTCRNKTIVQNSVDDVDKLMEAIKQNGLDNSEGYAKLAAMCQEQIDKTGETILKLETVIGFVSDVREELKELRSEVKMQGEEIKSHGVKIDKLLSKSEQEVENLRAQLRAAMSEKYVSAEKVKDFAKELLKKSADDFLANFCEVVYSDDPQRLNAFLDGIDSSKDIADVELIIEFLLNDLQSENVTSLKCLVGKLSLQAKYIDRIENEAEKVIEGIYNPKLKRDIFVAFAGADEGRVTPIVNYFVEQGFEVYFSLTNLRHGKAAKEVYWKELHEALSNCKCLVFCSSNNSRKNGCDALIELEYVTELNSSGKGIAMYEYILDEYNDRITPKLIKNTLKEYFDNRLHYTDLDVLSSTIFKYIQSKKLQAIKGATAKKEAAAEIVVEEKPAKVTSKQAETKEKAATKTSKIATAKSTLKNYDKSEFEIVGTELKKYKGDKSIVVIPDGVTSVGEKAFSNCTSMTNVEIPNSVMNIGTDAFYGCSNLTRITVDYNNPKYKSGNNCLIEKETNTLILGCKNSIIPNYVTSIGAKAYSGCSRMTSINIPSSVTSIGEKAFSGCSGLTSIEIPSSVTSIDQLVFFGCSSLTSIKIPSGVTSIGEHAFSHCSSLTSINIPSSVISISNHAFYWCISLTSIEIPSSVTSIGYHAFCECSSRLTIKCKANNKPIGWDRNWNYDNRPVVWGYNPVNKGALGNYDKSEFKIVGTELKKYKGEKAKVIIPDGVTSIGEWAFNDCSSLTSVVIPSSVTSIGAKAFLLCSSLTSIKIPSSVKSIGCEAFCCCSKLTSIDIPSSVTSIAELVFSGCSSLTSIEIPSGVTSIGKGAFSHCSSLTNIEIPSSVTSIGEKAFSGCSSFISINIPSSVTSIGEKAFSGCSGFTSINIPSSVTSIGEYAFSQCSGLTSINIPISVTSIEKGAFSRCSSLTNIDIPSSVTSIGTGVFQGCSSLKSINIPSSVTSIGIWTFYECISLTSIEIPNSVTSIGDGAFWYCSSLTSIEIPNSITSIGFSAFDSCSSLTTIKYFGKKKEWKIINSDENWKEYGRIIYCSNGKIKC